MNKIWLPILFLIVGFGIGNVYPIANILFPEREYRLKAPLTLKAGAKMKSRYYGTSAEPPTNAEFVLETSEPPDLEPLPPR